MTNIYVGNLPYSMTEDDLSEIFGAHGPVSSANIIKDRYSGQSKGFGFVEMEAEAEATAAIEALDGSLQQGRNIKVNKAKPKSDKPRSSGGPRRY